MPPPIDGSLTYNPPKEWHILDIFKVNNVELFEYHPTVLIQSRFSFLFFSFKNSHFEADEPFCYYGTKHKTHQALFWNHSLCGEKKYS